VPPDIAAAGARRSSSSRMRRPQQLSQPAWLHLILDGSASEDP